MNSQKYSWKRRTKLEESHFLGFGTHHKATVIKTKKKWYHYKDRHMDQLKDNPSRLYYQIFFDKGAKIFYG